MTDLTNISVGNAAVVGLLGYAVVFLGLVLLMFVIMILGKLMMNKKKAAEAAPAAAVLAAPASQTPAASPAPGTAGDVMLYGTDPRDAAMVMAIVANSLGKPLNELRFKSIKEVEE